MVSISYYEQYFLDTDTDTAVPGEIHRHCCNGGGEILCRSLALKQSADDLVDVLKYGHEEVNLPMLGAVLFERGFLASRYLCIHPTRRITLGDIGYVTEVGTFVVADNIHQSLQAEYGSLSWSEGLLFVNGDEFLELTPVEVVGQAGKSYQRRK